MPSEAFGFSAISMLVTSEISLDNSNTKYDPPENDGSVISISAHNINDYNSQIQMATYVCS